MARFFKELIEYKTVVLIFSATLCEAFFSLTIIERDTIRNVHWSSSTRYSYQILIELFPDRFSKNIQTNFMNIFPQGDELFHADGETDMTNSCFSQCGKHA
jgi:hypothetical protein